MPPILNVTCEILKNVPYTDPDNGKKYMAVSGKNTLVLVNDKGGLVIQNISKALWAGSGSPYPTPPGGDWKTRYIDEKETDKNYKKVFANLGRCFAVFTPKESGVYIHRGELSMGCFMVNKNQLGDIFFKKLIEYRAGLLVSNQVNDMRSEAEMAANPIDYEKIGRIG